MKLSNSLSAPLALLLAAFSPAAQRQLEHVPGRPPERRVALVVGNSAYKVGPLKNPVNDARAMTQALRELSFEVLHREELGREEMRRAVRDFGAQISRGGVGLFYYAGHGVQVRGENYLVPVDAAPESADEVDDYGVKADYVLEKMEAAGNAMNIVILDACRNNPFTRSFRSGSDGLASVTAPAGTIIAYATAPGAVAGDGGTSGNGIYTQELLKVLKTPGLGIEEVFKRVRVAVHRRTQGRQTPWESSSLVGDFYFSAAVRRDGPPAKVAQDFARAKETDGPAANQPAANPTSGREVERIPFLVFHRHRLSLKAGRLLVSPDGLEYREVKGGDESHHFSAPCGGFGLNSIKEKIHIQLPDGKELNLVWWGGMKHGTVPEVVSDFCAPGRPVTHTRSAKGAAADTSTRTKGASIFDGFKVFVFYKDRDHLAEAARIANRLSDLGAFAGVMYVEPPYPKAAKKVTGALLEYHDDLEGIALRMAQEAGAGFKIVPKKTGIGRHNEFSLWLP